MAGAKGAAGSQNANKRRRRTRKTRTAVYDASSSWSSDSEDSSNSSDGEDDSSSVSEKEGKGKGKAHVTDDSDSSEESDSSDDSDSSDSSSSSESSSGASTSSSSSLSAFKGKRRTAAAAQSLPSTASESKRLPLLPQEAEAQDAIDPGSSKQRRREKFLEREQEAKKKRRLFTPSDEEDEDGSTDAQERAARRMAKLHGRALPSDARGFWRPDLLLPPLPPVPPRPERELLPGERDFRELRKQRMKAARLAQSNTQPDGGAEKAKGEDPAAHGDSAAKREVFKDLWMKAVAEEFGEELNKLRQRDATLTENPERLPLLIDSLRSGANLFRVRPKGAEELDEIDFVLQTHARSQEDGKADEEMDAA